MGNDTNLQKIRERILSGGYGRFDFVEKILTPEELLNSKPRVVFSTIAEQLSIAEDIISRKTFWAWLSRYKKKHRLLNPEAGATKLTRESKMHPVSSSEKKVTNMDWLRDFPPLEPENARIRPAVISVIHSDRNSKKQ